MKEISEKQQKALDSLYLAYYTYLSEYELGHPFDATIFPWYHKNDFRENIEEEAHAIKVNYGY